MNAKEAKEKADFNKPLKKTVLYNAIIKTIESKANEGQYHFWYRDLPLDVKEKLTKQGFKIIGPINIPGSGTLINISWEQ